MASMSSPATLPAFAADVTVKATGFHNTTGKALVYLWKTADGFPSKTEQAGVTKTVDITAAGVTVTFTDVTPGPTSTTTPAPTSAGVRSPASPMRTVTAMRPGDMTRPAGPYRASWRTARACRCARG